jgi:hypothetical protein
MSAESRAPRGDVRPAPTAIGPQFTQADFTRALKALGLCLQNDPLKSGDQKLTLESVLRALTATGITLELARALIERLVQQGVFTRWSRAKPTGVSDEGGIRVPRSALQTTHGLVISRERWYGHLASIRQQGTTAIDTEPTDPTLPEPLIESAMRDVPSALADMDNTTEYGAGDPAPGQRVVLYHRLVRWLGEKWDHNKAAAKWAIHRLVQQGMLTARCGLDCYPAWKGRDGVVHGGEEYDVPDVTYSLIESAPRLWEWWEAHQSPKRSKPKGNRGRRQDAEPQSPKSKRSTIRGEARGKLIAALTKHHKYADGGCLNTEPIAITKLADTCGVAKASASRFFKKEFGGHSKYCNVYCQDERRLLAALKKLNDEYTVDKLFGGSPP